MGGGGGDHGHHGDAAHCGDFRNKVWSMTGGLYCRPKHWKRNTAIAVAGIFLICIPIAMKSAQLEIRAKTGDSHSRIADFFDIVAGTGIGALFAAMLTANDENERPLFIATNADSSDCSVFY
ncbi:hypothetical protein TEA_014699 [Camellia sinensis var. sinensis]|uniref:Uncharacterized protein n=1 Tax=Camellia sinensis var. sinensis TaxID=542762 RepID=A0A4S4DW67_CAMSN|nr:hypothetical protein TEA_014699 [Camellia sinensis var. sinensis]